MKKSLIALAVAGAMTAPIVAQADATLYGSIRVGLANADTSDNDGDWQVTDETSRIGIKGDVDLGLEGTTGYFQFETRLRADNGEFAGVGEKNARLALVGAKGAWGAAQAGRMYTPHWLWTSSVADAGWNHANAGVIREVGLRQPNTVAYISPDMSGFQIAGAAIMGGVAGDAAGGDENDNDMDAYNVAAKFSAAGAFVGLSYMSVDSDYIGGSDYDILGVAASYTVDAFKVYARYQDEESVLGTVGDDIETTQVGGSYTIGDTILQARWTNIDSTAAGTDGDQWMVGVQQNLGKRARVWVEYADVDDELVEIGEDFTNEARGFANTGGFGDTLSIGYRLDF
ncbi:porin [Marinobacterium sediminicola]|uniref:Outer membrane protein (Porin) n=1 Tax=Marinobacterium sediminicola TaxID=518898 RepID=A0ABY1RWZ7_9GAMM|nr:porin [Marinobacterium sediminicola]ULG67917.1 porin [Marinobacterium sediminicola]SMR71374.1 Outer membrane protein (porin) [Marinobacterium sediminicola]